MELRQLGPRGPQVSPLALGGTKFGRREGVKYPTSFELPSDGELAGLLALAKDLGINLIDTAPAYGSSEARIGTLAAADDHWRIATKVGETLVDGQSQFDFSPAMTFTPPSSRSVIAILPSTGKPRTCPGCRS